jgi:hypothetical protein
MGHGDDELSAVKRRLSEALAVIEQREEPAVEYEAPVPDSDKQRRMKSFTVDLPAGLYRRFKLACIDAGRTIAEEVLSLVERRTEEMEVATAMERFRTVAGERDVAVGELLEHALDAFLRETKER